jgi:ParB family chromosome partitioning protein
VEQGLFNMSFALLVARSDDSAVQNILMDAFDNGMVNSSNLPTVRRVIESRMNAREDHGDSSARGKGRRLPAYSIKQLRSDITKVTKEKEAFIHETSVKENRLITLLQGLAALAQDEAFTVLLQAEGLDQRPELKGKYSV